MFTVKVRKAKVEMLHQVGVGDDHVEDVAALGLDVTLDHDALAAGHEHTQVPLRHARLALLRLLRGRD